MSIPPKKVLTVSVVVMTEWCDVCDSSPSRYSQVPARNCLGASKLMSLCVVHSEVHAIVMLEVVMNARALIALLLLIS